MFFLKKEKTNINIIKTEGKISHPWKKEYLEKKILEYIKDNFRNVQN